jgi:hypothetical protein
LSKAGLVGVDNPSFPIAPNVSGDQVLLGVPLTTKPGDYSVGISFVNEAGEERTATLQVTVEPFATGMICFAGIWLQA